MHRRDDVRVETPPPAFSSRSPLFIAAVLSSSALFDSLSLYLSLSLLFREKTIRRQKRNGNRTHRFLSLKIQQSSFANEKKPLPPPCVCLGLSLSLSLSLCACARVRSSPRVNTNKARTIRLRISKVQNQTLNIHWVQTLNKTCLWEGAPKMSFPRKNGRRRERKRGTRKVSSTSRLRFARRTTPRVRTAPMSISSRVVVVFFLPWAFKAQFRDFLASGCVSNWAKSARAGQHWTGAREGTDAKGIEF